MRRTIAFVALALASGVLASMVIGGAAGAALKAQPVIEQNNPAFDPFQIHVTPKSGFCQVADVAAGKRWVIEYVSAYVEESSDNLITVDTTGGGGTATQYIPVLDQPGESTISIASQAVRLYADPSTEVTVCSSGLAGVTLSGHLVPVP